MTYTKDQLKAALVAALPDKLNAGENSPYWVSPLFSFVTEHEWLTIVSMVEERLTEESAVRAYVLAVYEILERTYEGFEYAAGEPCYTAGLLMTAGWEIRALGLAKVKLITL